MAELTRVQVSPILREMGEKGWDRKMMVNGHTLLTEIETKTDAMSGDYFKIPVQYNSPAGRSHDPAVAVANAAGSGYKSFEVTEITDYLIFSLKGVVVRKAANSDGETAFVDAFKQEVDSALEREGDNLGKEAYGSTSGARARVHPTTAISTTSLTLDYPSSAAFFYPNMYVCASATDGSALRDSGDRVLVTAVNLSTGVLTGSTNWSGISGITNGDYLYAEGDWGAAAAGLEAWNPATAPGATTFFGVDRSVAPDFLGGMRFDGSSTGYGSTFETVFIQADALMRIQTGNPFKMGTQIYINPISAGNLAIAKEGSRFIEDKNEYKIGIEKYRTRSGHVIVEDRDCPEGIARVIGPDCYMHMTNGDQPNLADIDGVELVYTQSTDIYSASVVIDHNFGARKPQGLMRITLPSA